jgi:hypothetical protein
MLRLAVGDQTPEVICATSRLRLWWTSAPCAGLTRSAWTRRSWLRGLSRAAPVETALGDIQQTCQPQLERDPAAMLPLGGVDRLEIDPGGQAPRHDHVKGSPVICHVSPFLMALHRRGNFVKFV